MRSDLLPLLRCPSCHAGLDPAVDAPDGGLVCANSSCRYSRVGFPLVGGKPAIIDFDHSIIARERAATSAEDQAIETSPGLKERLRGYLMGGNDIGPRNCRRFVAELRKLAPRPRVLVVGGGSRGAGTEALYEARDIDVIGTDIYTSRHIELMADGHSLPFKDGVFHGIVIQAVLEHVLDPPVVVAEMHRVLAPRGLVYAETPFMQQVHMAAYDFTRFTPSGHRWLFRRFEQLDAGTIGGPGLSLFWSLRYFIRALTRSDKVATALAMPFFWLRYLDRLADPRFASDGANGVYFIGRRSERSLRPRQMLAYYPGPAKEPVAGVELEPAWPSVTIMKSSVSPATPASRTSSLRSGGLPRSIIRTRIPATSLPSSASRKSTRLMRR